MHSRDIMLPGDVSVRLNTTSPVFDEARARLLAAAYLPGLQFADQAVEAPTINITVADSTVKQLVVRGRNILLSDRWNGDGSLLDLLHLTYSAARRHWLRRGLYSVHSACVVADGHATMLVGHSGAGKTTVAMELVNAGAKLFSGNKTLVTISGGSMIAVAGTRTMTTRQNAAGAPAGSGYAGRLAFALADDTYATETPIPIGAIALVGLNDGVADTSKMEPTSALHRLFPFFLDTVYADTVVLGGGDVYFSTPPRGCQKALSISLSQALTKVHVYSVVGSKNYISYSLERL